MDRLALRTALNNRLVDRDDVNQIRLDGWLDDGLLDMATQRFNLRSLEVGPIPITLETNIGHYPIPNDSANVQLLGVTYVMQLDPTRINQRRLVPWTGSFEQYLQSVTIRQTVDDDAPLHFALYGNDIFVYPVPGANVIANGTTLDVYGQRRPFMGPNDTDTPNIELEWHYPIQFFAAAHAFRELGDEERAAAVMGEFKEWYAPRETARRLAKRFNPSEGGARPMPGYFSRRTGV